MRFLSTRDADTSASLPLAIVNGIAADGGLYVPATLPVLSADSFPEAVSLPAVAEHLLRPYTAGDSLDTELASICREAFDFEAPLVPLDRAPGPASVLELFHGPTCAFKDFGARFLAASFERIRRSAARPLTILVATSGDTGGAVAAAFHNRPGVEVLLLYPKGLVSARQAQQLACWGGNVRTFAVLGNFDDCQRLAKEAFRDPRLAQDYALSSANSINIGRLLPQMAYYASASLQVWRRDGQRPGFIIPAGNLGNAVACVWARKMGLPIGDIVLATNENRTIVDYMNGGPWRPRPVTPTLASAMDVGDPSNMERLRWLYGDDASLRKGLSAYSVSDPEIRSTIRSEAASVGYVWCPHGATAAHVYGKIVRARPDEHWILVATAHPAKFNDIVEPLLGRPVPVPAALARLLELPRREEDLPAALDALRGRL
jgi:threonine synthase